MSEYYLAYGSNLNIPQMRKRCPDAKIAGTGVIKNYRLMYKGSGSGSYMTIEKAEGYEVPVAVWAVSRADIVHLDMYEGYPTFYYTRYFDIEMNGMGEREPRKIKAFAYIMHEERELGVPSDHYVKVCSDGYTAFGFDPMCLEDALEYSIEGWLKRNRAARKVS